MANEFYGRLKEKNLRSITEGTRFLSHHPSFTGNCLSRPTKQTTTKDNCWKTQQKLTSLRFKWSEQRPKSNEGRPIEYWRTAQLCTLSDQCPGSYIRDSIISVRRVYNYIHYISRSKLPEDTIKLASLTWRQFTNTIFCIVAFKRIPTPTVPWRIYTPLKLQWLDNLKLNCLVLTSWTTIWFVGS